MSKRNIAFLSILTFAVIIAMFSFFGLSLFLKDPDELITTTIVTKNALGQEQAVVLQVRRKYLTTYVRNEGEPLNLKVGYPDKTAVASQITSSDEQPYVSFYIASGDTTLGDRYKAAIDSGVLESKFGRTLVGKSEGRFALSETSSNAPERHGQTELIYDSDRQQWFQNRLIYTRLSEGEGLIKSKSISVGYHYTTSLVDPAVAHQWALSFVESLIVNNPNTAQGK